MKKGFMKKCMAVLMGALCVTTFAGCSGSDEQEQIGEITPEVTEEAVEVETASVGIDLTDADLITEGTLTVGMVIDYPPFEYYPTNGTMPIGIDVDIVNAVAKQLGLQVEIKDVPWDDALFTNMGSLYDVVCSAVTITDDRLDDMIFSDPYIDSYQSIVVRENSDAQIKSFEDLAGMKVAVQKGTVSDELMQSYIEQQLFEIDLMQYEVATDCFEKLMAGTVDAIVCDSTVTEGQIARNEDKLEEAFRDKSKVEKFAIAIHKQNQGLQRAINEALDILETEGIEKMIIDSWFSK